MKYYRKISDVKRGNKNLALIERVDDGKVAVMYERWFVGSGFSESDGTELLQARNRTESRIDQAEWEVRGMTI